MQSLWLKSFRQPFKYLFVFAHMRSGSSLLTHILNSNSEIIGFGETKTEYLQHSSLDKLLEQNANFFEKKRLRETYVMDKIVQDELFLDWTILQRPDVYCIFLLREPGPSLTSIVSMYKNIFPQIAQDFVGGETEALTYYTARLEKMAQIAETAQVRGQSYFLTFDQLKQNTQSVFSDLKDFLKVRNDFNEIYQTHKATGVPGIGDYSESIKTGKILKEKDSELNSLALETIESANLVYRSASARLKAACKHLQGDKVL